MIIVLNKVDVKIIDEYVKDFEELSMKDQERCLSAWVKTVFMLTTIARLMIMG